GPARVPDAVVALDRAIFDHRLQVDQLSFGAQDDKLMLGIADRDAGGIIASVFQTLQSIENDRDCLLLTDVSDNSTHKDFILRLDLKRNATERYLCGVVP